MAKKNNFLLSDDWKEMFCSLPDDKAGQLIKAAFNYHAGEEYEIADPVLEAVFVMIKTKMDENDAKYQKTCEARKDAVAKRWKEKDTKEPSSIQSDTKVYKCIQTDTDNDSDNDKEKDVPKGTSKKKHKHGEYKHVLLTDDEYEKLVNENGQATADEVIKFLDEYIEDKGYKSKSHYMAIKRWVLDAVNERKAKNRAKNGGFAETRTDSLDAMFASGALGGNVRSS